MKAQEQQHCGVCEPASYERNNYYYGKQFTVRDLQLEQRYFLDKMALINRAVLGWGVVCGLEAELCEENLVVHQGLAIDCCGRQILVCEPFTLCLESLMKQYPGQKYAICLEYDECLTEECKLPSEGCGNADRHESNRIRDHYRIKLKPWEDKCHARRDDPMSGLCAAKHPASQEPEPVCPPETLHSRLCHHLQCHHCDCCACVVLGQITLGDPISLDACKDRRIVYSNSMLYKLIECYHGDLAHIVDFNWRQKTREHEKRRVSWEWFVQQMQQGLQVKFDRNMDPNSISRHTFIVTLTFTEPDTGRVRTERVPPQERPTTEAHGHCGVAKFRASLQWLQDERNFSVLREGFGVEITLRGSNIYAQGQDGRPGKALDGDFIGEMLPTGNGAPGGDFFDWFQVSPPPHVYQTARHEDNY